MDPAGNKHIGIWNCMRRMEVLYGENTSLEIASQQCDDTSIISKIQYKEAEEP